MMNRFGKGTYMKIENLLENKNDILENMSKDIIQKAVFHLSCTIPTLNS